MDDLEVYRKEIDSIDSEITKLFEKRMNTVLKVAEYKKLNNLPIFHKGREEAVIKKNIDRLENKDYEKEIEKFFNGLMEVSRELQSRKLNREKDSFTFKKRDISREDVIGFLGPQGSFSEEAFLKYFGEDNKSIAYQEFEDIFIALKNGDIDYGVLPVENSSTGGINEVHDLLVKYGFYIIGEESIRIDQHLIGIHDAKIDDIKEVYSHPQGFSQTSEFLKLYNNFKLIPYHNTAISAKLIKDLNDKSKAAIASSRAAKIYDLDIIKEEINNIKNNYTRFIVVGKELLKEDNADKISVVFSLEDKSGTLYRLLRYFAENNINMMRIESRPIKNENWKYLLYVDFEGSLENFEVVKTLKSIEESSEYFRVLGWYKKRMDVK
ncbi:prephenate dehydratase [Clostridium sp.]|uniref:prephenate dehydratase n=1 Tax=Clostridium sp. TaxID=1506 RepID=UPI002A90A56D|nr:prephenate dehydratase [Clostridium sp.]MDY6013068.1 prephenate dehydratase [Clostridium sp.]